MKLLTWMHRKLRQNNTNEMLPPGTSGQAMFNTQHLHSKPSGAAFAQPPAKESHHLRKAAAIFSSSMECVELDCREFPEPCDGFLAIGTLGSTETTTTFMSTEPETPTFSISVDNIAERESQYVTEGELKLINDELEKVLGAETKEEEDSSATSAAPPAQVVSGKTTSENNNVCPLQGYLFGSTVELPAAKRVLVEKKENRTSLGELFQRQKAADEGGGWGSISSRSEPAAAAGGEKRSPGKETAINHLMKKILKRNSNNNNNSAAASPETKLHKVLHMFQKKVHPETSSTCTPRLSTQYDGGCRIKHGDPLDHRISYGDGNKELWIKSDADYLVLEL